MAGDEVGPDEEALRERIARLQDEVDRLRATRSGSVDIDQLARLRAQVAQLSTQNDRLASTLRDAREHPVVTASDLAPGGHGPAAGASAPTVGDGRHRRRHTITQCRRPGPEGERNLPFRAFRSPRVTPARCSPAPPWRACPTP